MYNFRYHLVTIVSIFAALVIGLLLGIALTGSDLVRDASSNLAQSLSAEFEELNAENDALSDQLQQEVNFAESMLQDWQGQRLAGRTIAIIDRGGEADAGLVNSLKATLQNCGAAVVVISLDVGSGLNIADSKRQAALKQMVPAEDGEEYAYSVARALADEWTYAISGGEASASENFEGRYPLTRHLLTVNAIAVTADYQSIIDQLSALDPHTNPNVNTQLAFYEQAQENQLPYGVNGIIDAAWYVPAGEENAVADSDALNLALVFNDLGRAAELPYLSTLAPQASEAATSDSAADQDLSTALDGKNYFSLLVATDDKIATLLAGAQSSGLSAVFSPLDHKGQYSIIALLSGGVQGSYGLNHGDTPAFSPVPEDALGNLAFTRD